MPDPKTILQRLLEKQVDFIVIGGLAATLYGASTVTYDVDVCFDFTRDNIEKLIRALKDLHPRVRTQKRWTSLMELSSERLSSLQNLYLKMDSGSLDLLGSLREIGSYDQVKKRSIEIEVFNKPCRVLDIGALIEIKEGIGRPKDQQVVLELKAILEKGGMKKTSG